MAFVTSLVTFLKVLPKLVDFITQLGAAIEKHKLDKWLDEAAEGFKELDNAKSTTERLRALRRISGSIRGL